MGAKLMKAGCALTILVTIPIIILVVLVVALA